ncbi:hypothetical protein FB45DRAFT_545661 [Roridomyces roridus]|uniref:RING-type domain-containing protein n=1 Tax=Roridomyces roridus TaxID=1738132 RepID=A0AAD7BV51_9AGAR|nr:hypothetical protein FB45DRAFT_545661 [Roridomyces roridus]
MPLVVESTSSCDVCLNIYWAEGDAIPAVIACGHTFCRTCLETLDPPNCPLCRKAFNPDRIKKLHVDRPEPDLEADLLRHAALAFYETDEEVRKSVAFELDQWLQRRSDDDDEANPIRMVRAAFHDLNRLNEWRAADRQTIRELSRQLIQQTDDSKHERDTSKAVEISLTTQVTELTAYVNMTTLFCSR